MTRHTFRPGRFLVIGLSLSLVFVAVACGSTSSSTSSASASPTAAASTADQVKAGWQQFFAGTTPAAQKIALLQNGQRFAKTIKAQAASPIAQGTQAKVTSVKITSPTTATVTYSIAINGQTALADQTGQAVREGGIWKVGSTSFQGLLALEQGGGLPSSSSSPTR
jgi:hypothetical protein